MIVSQDPLNWNDRYLLSLLLSKSLEPARFDSFHELIVESYHAKTQVQEIRQAIRESSMGGVILNSAPRSSKYSLILP